MPVIVPGKDLNFLDIYCYGSFSLSLIIVTFSLGDHNIHRGTFLICDTNTSQSSSTFDANIVVVNSKQANPALPTGF